MTWVRLDDNWCESEPVLLAGVEAAWLHVCALSWCNRGLTDGRVPQAVVRRLTEVADPLALAARLVEVGMWSATPDGFLIVDYHATQPSRAQVEQERAKAAERQRKWREARSRPRNGVTDGVTTGVSAPSPTRPAPKGSGSGTAALAGVCTHGLRRRRAVDGSSNCVDCDADERSGAA